MIAPLAKARWCLPFLLALTACGPFNRSRAAEAEAILIFRNQSVDQATVFAALPGRDPQRLGTVFPGQTDTLRVPSSITRSGSPVNIIARLLARPERPQSGSVTIGSGDVFVVTLNNNQSVLVITPAEAPPP